MSAGSLSLAENGLTHGQVAPTLQPSFTPFQNDPTSQQTGLGCAQNGNPGLLEIRPGGPLSPVEISPTPRALGAPQDAKEGPSADWLRPYMSETNARQHTDESMESRKGLKLFTNMKEVSAARGN